MSTELLDRGSPNRQPLFTVWLIVNAVNVAQAIGFVSRVSGEDIQRIAGLLIAALAVPAAWALVELVRNSAGWRLCAGPVAFLAFVTTQIVVEYLLEIEFRTPGRAAVLVPYVTLFFGSIVLMGAPMFRINRRLWLVTVATSAVLLLGMGFALYRGVG